MIVSNSNRSQDFVARIEDIELYADGSGADKLRQRIWDMSIDPFLDWKQVCSNQQEMIYAEMDGQYIFRRAVKEMSKAIKKTLKRKDMSLDDIDMIIAHQANLNINNTIASILNVPSQKMPHNIERVGNTTAASIPLLLSELHKDGKIKPDNKLLLVAFGSGLTWGTGLIKTLTKDAARSA